MHEDSMRLEHKTKLFFRVFKTWKYEKQMQTLFESLKIEDILAKHPRFYNKFSRPHLKSNLNNAQKMRFMTEHYHYMVENFEKQALHHFYHDSALLYDFEESGIDLQLNITYMRFLEREGEIMLNLTQHDGTRIYSMAGTFYEGDFYISGIQGYKDIELIRKYTKACFGMRPHNLLFYALLTFLKNLGVARVFAISNEEQIYNEKKTKKKVLFDYEDFFEDIYAKTLTQEDGWFLLDLDYPLKPIEEVKSKKRSMYKKRYALLESMDISIYSSLEAYKR